MVSPNTRPSSGGKSSFKSRRVEVKECSLLNKYADRVELDPSQDFLNKQQRWRWPATHILLLRRSDRPLSPRLIRTAGPPRRSINITYIYAVDRSANIYTDHRRIYKPTKRVHAMKYAILFLNQVQNYLTSA